MASIQGVYVALFGRPADPTGLAYFNSVTNNGGDLSKIGDLAASQEYKDRFAGQSNVQIVNSIYKSLFNRDAEVGGLTFFVDALNKGTLNINNIAIAILDGAQGADKTIVETKIKAADAYTAALDTGSEIVAYNGSAAAAAGRAFLAPVSTTEPTAAAVTAAVDAMVKAGNGGGTGTAGVILTLTNGADVFTTTAAADASKTTAGNDTIRGLTAGDLASADIVDGGAGTDTLNAALDPAAAASIKPVLTSVENVNLTFAALTADTVAFDAGDTSGIVNLSVSGTMNAAAGDLFTLSGVQNSTVVAVKNLVINDDAGAGAALAGVVTVGFRDVAGTSDAAKISLEGATFGVNDTLRVNVAGIEALSINSANAANVASISAVDAKSFTITGDKDLTITHVAGNAALKTVDASALTGKLTYTATANGETITTGQKADVINLGGGADVVVYTASSKSTLNTLDDINNFTATADKFDLKAFALGADTTLGTTVLSPAGDTAGFFTGTGRIVFNAGTSMIYVDADKDGTFDAVTDLAIDVTGIAGTLAIGNFILA